MRLIPALLPAQLKQPGLLSCSCVFSLAHSGFIAGSIETSLIEATAEDVNGLIPALLPAQLKLAEKLSRYRDFGRLIPALLPAQLKQAQVDTREMFAHPRLIPALLPAQLKPQVDTREMFAHPRAHSGFIAGSIETFTSVL